MPLSVEEHDQMRNNIGIVCNKMKNDYELVIAGLEKQIQTMRDEFEVQMDEGYQEAYEMLCEERQIRELLEVQLYEEYDKRLKDMKTVVVDKVHQFLAHKWEEFAQAGMDELAHKLDIWRKAITPAEIVEAALEQGVFPQPPVDVPGDEWKNICNLVEHLKTQIKLLEARNIRLQVENAKLNEAVREMGEVMAELAPDLRKKGRANVAQWKRDVAFDHKNEVRIE